MVKESWDRWSVGANGFLDPGRVFADLRVDSWVLSRAAGISTPGKDALQGLITDQGATGVTLAGVLALVQSCTYHVVGEYTRVEDLTLFVAQDSDSGAAQAPVVLHSSGGRGAPARDVALVSGLGTAVGQAQGLDTGPEHRWPA